MLESYKSCARWYMAFNGIVKESVLCRLLHSVGSMAEDQPMRMDQNQGSWRALLGQIL